MTILGRTQFAQILNNVVDHGTVDDENYAAIMAHDLAQRRKLTRITQSLKELTLYVGGFIKRLDSEMRLPSTPERGGRIAKLSNELEMANDATRYFGLGIDYRTDKKT